MINKSLKIAKLKTQLFRLEYPDIKKGSCQEKEIADLITKGESSEIAYKIIKYFYQRKGVPLTFDNTDFLSCSIEHK